MKGFKYSFAIVVLVLITVLAGCSPAAPAQPVQPTAAQAAAAQPTAAPAVPPQPAAAPAAVQPTATPAATTAPTAVPAAAVQATAAPATAAWTCNIDPPAQKANVTVIGWAFPIMQYYADQFKKCGSVKNIQVDVKLLDGPTAQQQVRLALSAGKTSPYAVVHADNQTLIEWASQGWLMPLDDLIKKYRDQYNLGDIPQAAWDGATINGHIYGVPPTANTFELLYRPDLFQKYNLKVPTTYDDVIAACKVLKDEKSINLPFAMDLEAGWAWEFEFFHFLRSFGGDYLNADSTPAFNDAKGVAALTKLKEVVDACMGAKGLSYSLDDQQSGMATGKIAFANMWASRAAGMDDPAKSDYVGKIEFAPAAMPNPGGKLGASAWNDYYTIPKTTNVDPDLVFRMIMEVTNQQSQVSAAKFGLVTRAAVAKTGAGGRYYPAAMESVAKGVGIYQPNPAVPLAVKALGNWLAQVGAGKLTPQQALDSAAKEYSTEAAAQGFIKK